MSFFAVESVSELPDGTLEVLIANSAVMVPAIPSIFKSAKRSVNGFAHDGSPVGLRVMDMPERRAVMCGFGADLRRIVDHPARFEHVAPQYAGQTFRCVSTYGTSGRAIIQLAPSQPAQEAA